MGKNSLEEPGQWPACSLTSDGPLLHRLPTHFLPPRTLGFRRCLLKGLTHPQLQGGL